MNRAGMLLAATLLATGGCSADEQTNEAANNAAPAAVAGTPAPGPATNTSAPAGPGCAGGLAAELDRESIVSAMGKPAPTQARLDAFRIRAGEAFKTAANKLCASGKLAPDMLKSFTTVIVQSGAGADSTAVYEDPHDFRSEDLIFQWTFAEADLDIPDAQDIEMGISCWNDPDQPVCADRIP